jgi:hypothetical protein
LSEPPSKDAENLEPLRPRDLALLLLASGDLLPRKRARDQQADCAGLDLKRRVLDALAALDPEPEDVEAALLAIVEDLGQPTGPARAIGLAVLEEWRTACATPGWVEQLLAEGLHNQAPSGAAPARPSGSKVRAADDLASSGPRSERQREGSRRGR